MIGGLGPYHPQGKVGLRQTPGRKMPDLIAPTPDPRAVRRDLIATHSRPQGSKGSIVENSSRK